MKRASAFLLVAGIIACSTPGPGGTSTPGDGASSTGGCNTMSGCTPDADCTGGLSRIRGECLAPPASTCSTKDECMSTSCTAGRCACVPHDRECHADGDCCAGPCRSGICARSAGESCSAGECLRPDDPNYGIMGCRGGTCICGRIGGRCGTGSDCCSGTCERPDPSTAGECTEALPGDACVSPFDCAYSATTYGYPACAPDGHCKCSPKTGVCHTDAHCCEGPCVDGQCVAGPPATSCVTFGQASKDGADCCPSLFAPGGPGTACCGAPGRTCTQTYECCTNTCGADGRCP